MARLLFEQDIPFINNFIRNSPVKDLITDEEINVVDVHNTVFYISDDNNDLVVFDRLDRRVHHGHNIMTSKLKTALKNGRDIINQHFYLYPDLELIVGLTPWNYKTTRYFNNKLGFKQISLEYNNKDILCYRYELRRSEWHSK